MKPLNLPNIISFIRLGLVLPIVYFFIQCKFKQAFCFFAVANISDFLDGYLARRYNQTTQLGRIIDPAADKILITTVYVMIAFVGIIPTWALGLIILRDFLIIIGAYILYQRGLKKKIKPTHLSKINTVLQMLFVTWVLFQNAFLNIEQSYFDMLTVGFMYAVLVFTVASGLHYFYVVVKVLGEGRKK